MPTIHRGPVAALKPRWRAVLRQIARRLEVSNKRRTGLKSGKSGG